MAIKPVGRAAKQLDDGIDDTFVSTGEQRSDPPRDTLPQLQEHASFLSKGE
jgi:hypothetical protein